jgi:hypothetical protein
MNEVTILDAYSTPGSGPAGLTWDGRSLWQAIHDEGWLRCVNPHTNDFDRTIVIEDHGWLSGTTWDGQRLWAVSQQKGQVFALDRDRDQVVRTIPAPTAGGGLDYRAGSLWLGIAYPMHFNERFQQFEWQGEERHFAMVQLDATDGREIARYSLDFLPMGLAWVNDELWLTQVKERKLYRTRLEPARP